MFYTGTGPEWQEIPVTPPHSQELQNWNVPKLSGMAQETSALETDLLHYATLGEVRWLSKDKQLWMGPFEPH